MATTHEQNERLTRIGPGTPMGNLLRRYWQPLAPASELVTAPVRKVRIFGENLTLYRDRNGDFGLVAERCPHRCLSLEHGIPDEKGLRCAYHGWVFNAGGQCVEQPFEERLNPDSHYKDTIKITAYPVKELGGLLWAYLGPLPAPELPRWDILVEDDLDRAIEMVPIPCNWLQCMDNSADPVHFEFLHGKFGNYTLEKMGLPPRMKTPAHLKIDFDVWRFGIMKRRLLEGDAETVDDWTTGHPLIFPNTLGQGSDGSATFQLRLPVDDVNTIQINYRTIRRKPGAAPHPTTVRHLNPFDPAEQPYTADTIQKQDYIAWVGQGAISDRTNEHLTALDKGVILYHKLLFENMDKVERGEDPMGIIRDPAENEPKIVIPREKHNLEAFKITDDKDFDRLRESAGVETIGARI
jgi:5,5'-dehydrodivanillate O-demethylase oxygenase subunit